MKTILLALFFLIMAASICLAFFFFVPFTQDAQFKRHESIKAYCRFSGKKNPQEFTLSPGSELHEKINAWLNENRSGWYHSMITYGDVGYINLYSNTVSMNIADGLVVINYPAYFGWYIQVVKKNIDTERLRSEFFELSL